MRSRLRRDVQVMPGAGLENAALLIVADADGDVYDEDPLSRSSGRELEQAVAVVEFPPSRASPEQRSRRCLDLDVYRRPARVLDAEASRIKVEGAGQPAPDPA